MNKAMNILENKKARFEYFIEDTITCGMVLTSEEVKAIVNGKANIVERYCVDNNGIIFSQIGIKDKVGLIPLLISKNEKKRILEALDTPSYTVVPLSIFRAKNHLLKLNVGICRGKHEYDKRETIKARDAQREMRNAKSWR